MCDKEMERASTRSRSTSLEWCMMPTSESVVTTEETHEVLAKSLRTGGRRSQTRSPRPRGVQEEGRTRCRSASRCRKSRQSSVIVAYSKKHRTRLTVDALPKPVEEGETSENEGPTLGQVLRADSVSHSERRGRGYFRGVGNNFSTSAHRRRGRAPGDMKIEVFSGKGVLFKRALSPSPERVKGRRGKTS